MGYGSNNELMIFPIIDIVRKEMKRMLSNGQITLEQIYSDSSGVSNVFSNLDKSTKNINYANLMTALESNDFELELEKKDENNPNMLTGVTIYFTSSLKQIISLIRQNKKLTHVKISVISREASTEQMVNPLNMSHKDYVEYVRNKKAWNFYKEVEQDENRTQEEKDNAQQRIAYLETRNQEIRNVYNIEDYKEITLEDYMSYMPNPLGMEVYDFVEYVKNARAWASEEATQQQKDAAHEANVQLRLKYFIPEDDYAAYGTLEEISEYLPNPMGMQFDDFITYLDNIEEWVVLNPDNPEDLSRLNNIEQENNLLLSKYFIEANYDINLLEPFRERNTATFDEKLLLRILISLNYNQEGKLKSVKSEILDGD